jgi:hypothetical protein
MDKFIFPSFIFSFYCLCLLASVWPPFLCVYLFISLKVTSPVLSWQPVRFCDTYVGPLFFFMWCFRLSIEFYLFILNSLLSVHVDQHPSSTSSNVRVTTDSTRLLSSIPTRSLPQLQMILKFLVWVTKIWHVTPGKISWLHWDCSFKFRS